MELRKDISKFITQICEKNYSNANKTLESLIEKKLKSKIKKMHDECSCEKHGKLKKKKKKTIVGENADDFLNSKMEEKDFGNFGDETDSDQQEIDRVLRINNSQNSQEESSGEPEAGDIVMSSSGSLGSRTDVSEADGKHLGTFASEEKAEQFIRDYMQKHNFYPNVWFMDDHGGFSLREI